MRKLSKENAYVFRITHIDNMPWIMKHGLHCRTSPVQDPTFRTIGDPDLILKRTARQVPAGRRGGLSNYVSFYFTPFSPMLYKIKTGHGVPAVPMSDIVILATSLPRCVETETEFVFIDRHAYLVTARYFTDLKHLDQIDWKLIASRDFKRDTNRPDKVERYQAEALIYRHVPISTLLAIICYCPAAESRILEMQKAAGLSLRTVVNPDWFF